MSNKSQKRIADRDANPMADTSAFIVGAVIGAAAGVVAALWFAPQSGPQTRHDIRQRGLQLQADAERAASGARERVEGPSVDRLMAQAKADARDYKNASRSRSAH